MALAPDARAVAAEQPFIRLAGVTRTYGTAGARVEALRGADLEVRRGERVALLGRSGSGKSTLLHLLAGLDRCSAGSIRVAGRDLTRMSATEFADYRLTTVGMVFQAYHLIPSRSALQNVEIPMVLAGRPKRERRAAARAALDAVGLGGRLDHRPAELSGGEQQRVAIARALVNNPRLLLADEPTGNLDSVTAAGIVAILTDHVRAHGTTFLLVTHDEQLAGQCADRVLRVHDGRLVG